MTQTEIKSWVEMHEFPNRIRLHKPKLDFNGKRIPNTSILVHGPSSVYGTKIHGEEIFGLYVGHKDDEYWVNLKDADLYALRQYGSSRACV